MSDQLLSPEQIAVLRLIESHGIEARLTDQQRRLRDWLENYGYIYAMGDSYDFNYYLTPRGKLALAQTEAKWWTNERKNREDLIKHLKWKAAQLPDLDAELKSIDQQLKNGIEALEVRAQMARQEARARASDASTAIDQAERDFTEWLEANKDKLTNAEPKIDSPNETNT